MSEMIERAGRAVLAKVPQGYGMTQKEAEMYARTVLEFFREPFPEMLAAASELHAKSSLLTTRSDEWRAMIDEALK